MQELRPRRSQSARSAETRGRLLDATIECLIERGVAGTSTPEVCRRAGVSRGAQLHHFPTKASLMAAAVERLLARRHDEFRARLAEEGASLRDVDALLAALWEIYSGPTLHAWMEVVVASRTDPDLRNAMVVLNEQFVADAEQTFVEIFGAQNTPAVKPAARLIMALFDGLALNQILEDDHLLATSVLAVFRTLISGWLNPAGGGNA